MSERTFDRETLLDLTVNIVPLGIILFFFIVFIIVDPWEFDPFIEFVSIGLLIIPFAGLALLTYVSGRAIEEAEEADTGTAALDEPTDTSVESDETEDDADDVVTALNDGNDTDEDDETDETADSESPDHADAESDADDSAETDEER